MSFTAKHQHKRLAAGAHPGMHSNVDQLYYLICRLELLLVGIRLLSSNRQAFHICKWQPHHRLQASRKTGTGHADGYQQGLSAVRHLQHVSAAIVSQLQGRYRASPADAQIHKRLTVAKSSCVSRLPAYRSQSPSGDDREKPPYLQWCTAHVP